MTHRMITQPIKHIHPGVEFVLAETTDNKLFGWGKCEYLGISVHDCHFKDIMNVCNPIPVMEGVERVSVGTKHCLVLTQKGELYGWGEGSYFCK
jgi:alpha-tubulin suppressor-like RCC1 family protein